jgi:dipeptidyl aminopeptidase/acylaminoacyl peptidase
VLLLLRSSDWEPRSDADPLATLPRDPREEAEALIREARRRTLRRRALRAVALALLAGLAAGLYALLGGGGPGVIAETADSPLANARAFSGHGELAFVSRDQLWVLDGSAGTLRHLRVPAGYTAASPTFSRDGRWLAYVVETTNDSSYGPDQLWIAHADGTEAHRMAGVRLDQLVGWSPRGDVLAATVGEQLKYVPHGSPTAVDLIRPSGSVRTLVRAPAVPASKYGIAAIDSAVWSPTGTELAVSLQGGLASEIETVSVDAPDKPTIWFTAGNKRVPITGLPGRVPNEVRPDLAGWWPGRGIAFWVIDFGMSRNLDSTPLAAIRSPGARPRVLAQTLSTGVTDAVSSESDGKLALVASTSSSGRAIGSGKAVETCGAAACSQVPGASRWFGTRLAGPRLPDCNNCGRLPAATASGAPGSGVSEDPSWSPNGRLLAYVKAPSYPLDAWPDDPWFADHAVYVLNTTAGTTNRIGTVDGSALPTWSGNGKDLLYESNDGLWLMPISTGKPVEIVHPLYSEADWNSKGSHLASVSFYGQIPWQYQFSWWSPTGGR